MPMQPKPSAETSSPLLPNVRFCIALFSFNDQRRSTPCVSGRGDLAYSLVGRLRRSMRIWLDTTVAPQISPAIMIRIPIA